MKLGLTIKKNLKLLLRSRVSTLVLVLGPLLIILLVGLSFNSSTFNLNLAVYSDSYTDLSREFIATLSNESFNVVQSTTEQACIDTVKEQKTHACIVFPPDLALDNEGTKTIMFHFDQSKVNIVYLVISTLEESFTSVTTDISKELTDDIINTLFLTKAGIIDSQELASGISEKNSVVISASEDSSETLGELDFDTSGTDISISTEDIEEDLENLKAESSEIIDEALEFLENNISDSNKDVVEDHIDDLDELIKETHNSTYKQVSQLSFQLSSSLSKLTTKLESAGNANSQVISKLNTIKSNADDIKEKADELETKLESMVSDINSIQITNTENIVSPITTAMNPVVESSSNLGFLFPSLIVILIMFIGLMLPSTLIIMDKNSKAHFRIFTTPVKKWVFTVATYLTSISLLVLQVVIILSISQFYFNISFLKSPGILFISLFLIMSLFILIGMLIGYIFNSEEMAMLASVSIATILLLLSGIIFPIESMPDYIISKIKYNPVVSASEAFRKSILFDTSFASVKEPLGILLLLSALIVLLIFAAKKLENLNIKREKIDKNNLESKFDFGERKAKTLPEFIVSIQNMDTDKFKRLLDEDAYRNWLQHVNKNSKLAKKVSKIEEKEQILEILVSELKNNKK